MEFLDGVKVSAVGTPDAPGLDPATGRAAWRRCGAQADPRQWSVSRRPASGEHPRPAGQRRRVHRLRHRRPRQPARCGNGSSRRFSPSDVATRSGWLTSSSPWRRHCVPWTWASWPATSRRCWMCTADVALGELSLGEVLASVTAAVCAASTETSSGSAAAHQVGDDDRGRRPPARSVDQARRAGHAARRIARRAAAQSGRAGASRGRRQPRRGQGVAHDSGQSRGDRPKGRTMACRFSSSIATSTSSSARWIDRATV